MERQFTIICKTTDVDKLKRVVILANKLYPTQKFLAYTTPTGKEPIYNVACELSQDEFEYLCDEYTKAYNEPIDIY